MTMNQCQCGCGTPVSRSFAPGHDAKLKSALVAGTRSNQWWTRQAAAEALVARGWGHFADAADLAKVTTRSRHNGRFVETRHLHGLHRFINDQAAVSHSHTSCPAIQGAITVSTVQEWACNACIHTADLVDEAGRRSQMRVAATS